MLLKCLILHYIVCFCRQPSFSAAAEPYRPEDAVGRPCCGCGGQIGYSQPYYQLPLIPVNSFFRSPQIPWKKFLPHAQTLEALKSEKINISYIGTLEY